MLLMPNPKLNDSPVSSVLLWIQTCNAPALHMGGLKMLTCGLYYSLWTVAIMS